MEYIDKNVTPRRRFIQEGDLLIYMNYIIERTLAETWIAVLNLLNSRKYPTIKTAI